MRQYAIYGFIFYTLAMGMLLGSLIGIQVGALTTKVVKGIYIRGFYAMSILAGFINRFFAMPEKLKQMEYISISKGLAKLARFYRHDHLLCDRGHFRDLGVCHVLQEHQRLEGKEAPFCSGWLGRRSLSYGIRKNCFWASFSCLSFAVVLVIIFMPIFGNGRNGLQFSDDFFNSLAKGSSNFMEEHAK